jgi:hypothetical protein
MIDYFASGLMSFNNLLEPGAVATRVWFKGFLNGLAIGDEIEVYYGGTYRCRVTESRILPSCTTPYVTLEVIKP